MGFEKFCARCGQKTEALISGVCQECFLKKKELFSVPKPNFTVCKFCGKFLSHGKWFLLTDQTVGEEISRSVKFNHDLDTPKVFIEIQRMSPSDFAALVKVEGFIDGVLVKDEKSLNFSVRPVTCDPCMKLHANYREAVIQLRAEKAEARAMYDYAISLLDKEREANSLSGTSKIIESEHGFDLWVGSKTAAAKVARSLSKAFGLRIITSKKIIGEEGGRAHFKFRFTYCLKKK
jgi:nonsense-mediated mRNA decay protein 3